MELKRCPYCGGEARYVDASTEDYPSHDIECSECWAAVRAPDEATANHNWNRRVENDKLCKTCRHWIKGIGGHKVCNRGYCKGSVTRGDFECGNWQEREE